MQSIEAEPPAATESVPAERDVPLRIALDAVRQVLEEVRDELRTGADRAAARERMIDRLHEENQRLRAGDRQLLLRPILVDLQQIRNELVREAGNLPADFGPKQAAELLTSFADSIELALERGGAVVVRPAAGEPFDPAAHRASDVVPAQASADDRTIERVVADGYRDTVTDRVLSPACVIVRQWRLSPAPEPEQKPEPAAG